MPPPSLLVATWDDGLYHVDGNTVHHEIPGGLVRGLAADRDGSALAVVGRDSLRRRSPDGEWKEIARTDLEIACCVALGSYVFAGTSDARVIRIDPDGSHHDLTGFSHVQGRETWYAGTAIVDGKVMGPPLGIRSIAATCDGSVLLATVHVGGIPRSTDAGSSWHPTIDIESDVHEVRAHPSRPEIAIAASAAGLCISRDAGATWTIESEGLHANHCSAVAFGRNEIYVSASTDPFAEQGAVYRRPLDGEATLKPLDGGMPRWTDGKVDTGCIATRDAFVALIDWSGRLYLSHDEGASWSSPSERFPNPSGLLVC